MRQRVAFDLVEWIGSGTGDLPGGAQRNCNCSIANRQGDPHAIVGQLVIEVELERDVLDRIAIVVDVDLIDRVRIHCEIIRAAVRRLKRNVVRNERDVVTATRLVAFEHVKVRRIDFWLFCYSRRFAVRRRCCCRCNECCDADRHCKLCSFVSKWHSSLPVGGDTSDVCTSDFNRFSRK